MRCVCGWLPAAGVAPLSIEAVREHRDVHREAFPDCDAATVDALDKLVAMAERREARAATAVN